MLQKLFHSLSRFTERHGAWIHLSLALLFAYGALSWILRSDLWRGAGAEQTPALRQQVDWVRMLKPYSATQAQGGWFLKGTFMPRSGEGFALLEKEGQFLVVHLGDPVDEGRHVSSIGIGRLTLSSSLGIENMEFPALSAAAMQAAGTSMYPRVDVQRSMAIELFPALEWQVVPLGGNFAALRVVRSFPEEVDQVFGLHAGDLVEAVNGLPLLAGNQREVVRLFERFRNDENVTLGVRRGGRRVALYVTLHD
jgi:hypothetical protein